MIDKYIETIGGIDYYQTPLEFEGRYNGIVICNKDYDRLKQDAPAVIDLISKWKQDQPDQD